MHVSIRNLLWILAFGVLLMMAEYGLGVTSRLDNGRIGETAVGVERSLSDTDGSSDRTDGREPSR